MLSRRNADNEEAAAKSHIQLKQFLAQHKREMRSLRSNKFFQEFLNKANEGKRGLLPNMRIVDEPDNSMVATLDLIRKTAEKQNRAKEGVWSAFGQPYAPLGVPVQTSKQLPPLARDEINGIVRENPDLPSNSRASIKLMDAPGGRGGVGRSGESPNRKTSQLAQTATAETQAQLAAGTDGGELKTPGKPQTPVGGSLVQGEEALLCWAVSDEVEVRFPKQHLENSSLREKKSKSASSFVDAQQAYRELCHFEEALEEEEETALDSIEEFREDLQSEASVRSHISERSEDVLSSSSKLEDKPQSAGSASRRQSLNASKISQIEGEEEDVEGELAGESSVLKNERPYSSRSAMMQRAAELAKNPQPVKPPSKPVIRGQDQSNSNLDPNWIKHVLFSKHGHPLKPSRKVGIRKHIDANKGKDPANGDVESEDDSQESEVDFRSPVVRWRKEFLDVRQKMQEQLYNALEERATRRAMAMQSTLYTTAVANQLMEDMRAHGGRMLSVPANQKMDSWTRAEVAMHAQDQPKKVDVAEIQAIERFYEKLCHLVERQRVSDPLSLSVVHTVKKLLESGISMQRTLLMRVLEELKTIHQLGGADNPYIMPILHFIRQSVRVPADEFESLMHQMGLAALIVKAAVASRGTVPKPFAGPPSGLTASGSFKEAKAAEAEPDVQGEKSKAQPKLDFE